jgi:hypothetical protein
MMESMNPSAAQILDRTIAECPDKSLMTPDVGTLQA